MTWTDVIGAETLAAKRKAVIRRCGVQVLLLHTPTGVFAVANRCPHEGYPLSEGVLGEDCVLTCNWHNWKFDLSSGKTLGGGDRLRRFAVRIEAGRVLVDMTPEDPAVRRERALAGLRRGLVDEDQDRLVRETARVMRLGVDPAEPVTEAVRWAAERLEYGVQHGVGGAADWLRLHDRRSTSADRKLAAIGEILGHIAEDARGGQIYPFPTGEAPWSAEAFLRAVEGEDEGAAAARVRGGLAGGMAAADFLPTLVRAALGHYADFGHALIYAVNSTALAARLGPGSAEPLMLMVTRTLVYMTREDMLPEFRGYHACLDDWGKTAKIPPPPLAAAALTGRSARQAMGTVTAWSGLHPPEAIFATLVEAAAWMLLHADEAVFLRADGPLADNANWLDFTHALTFAEAGRTAVRLAPDTWPALLLQLACFIGRNGAYVDPGLDVKPFEVTDPRAFETKATQHLFDHGRDRFILSVHLLKTLLAGLALAKTVPTAAPTVRAALNRFLNASIKRRHVLRTARQMRLFVARE
jgi:nitrite reductase/ring-hydroxylating ferredoxin subunit